MYDGKSRVKAGHLVGMDRQILCDLVHRFNAGGPNDLANRTAPGADRRLTDEQETALWRCSSRGLRRLILRGLRAGAALILRADQGAVACHLSPAHGWQAAAPFEPFSYHGAAAAL